MGADANGPKAGARPRRKGASPKGGNYTDGSELTEEEIEFARAVAEFCRVHNLTRPTDLQVLEIAQALGWKKS